MYFSLKRQQQRSTLSASNRHLFQTINKQLKAMLLLALLMLLTTPQIRAQRFAVSVEAGFYRFMQRKLDVNLKCPSGFLYGISASYYATELIALNTGFSTVKLDALDNIRYYSIPFTVSLSQTKRGRLHYLEKRGNDIFSKTNYYSNLFFIPQTYEIETGFSLGIYDKSYFHQFESRLPTSNPAPNNNTTTSYLVTRKNQRINPCFNWGFKLTYDFDRLHLSVITRCYCPFLGDNKIIMEDLTSHKTETHLSYITYSATMALTYSF